MSSDGSAPAVSVLRALSDALSHRGPDGRGEFVAGGVALAQTRLAIIDLAGGDQPMFGPAPEGDEPVALIANGEIYNYVELRETAPYYPYQTSSDCESILQLYQTHGLDFAEHLRGMYALALYDPNIDTLILSRDPFGIKPLYYGVAPDGFVFASEAQALIEVGLVNPAVDPPRRDELLALQFTTGAETIFTGIYRVLPGETLVIRDGRIVSRKRMSALPPGKPVKSGTDAALAAFDAVMMQSVEVHQRSDVPYGMFLSGGIDSSVLLALMQRLRAAGAPPVHAISAGFPGGDVHDERDHARLVAAAANADFDEVSVTEQDFWTHLPAIAAAMDDPAADYAVVPTYLLARRAREAGLKVVLSGEGGDELFAGYGRYRRARRPGLIGGRRMRTKSILDGTDVLRETAGTWRDGIAAAEAEETGYGRTRLQAVQAVDCTDWLPNDLLIKLDRCLMANGVEGRVPFLDPFVAEFAMTLPDKFKVRGRTGKWLLRQWLSDVLPESRPFDKKKGFTVPVGEWIAARAADIGPRVAVQPGIAEVCYPDRVEALFNAGSAHGKAQWTLLFYALWHQCHVMRSRSDGDIADALSAS